ncbi:MAG: hypothetical protein JWM35_1332, partial [Verrucomicrobia bacterium]|nr:hypothetical protein [Verrucomicrobiota bacterium]
MNLDGPAADRSAPGPLDGLTLLRYGHTYDTGGGIEQYLVDLNRSLLDRSAFTTIQVQLTSDPRAVGETETNLGRGRLRRVSLFVEKKSHEQAVAGTAESPLAHFKHRVVDGLLKVPGVYPLAAPALRRRKIPRRDGEPAHAGETVRTLHQRFKADLICLHSAGAADVSEILAVAEEAKIPVVYVHHFSNDRLGGVSMRTQLDQVDGVAGVSGADIPSFLRARFRNVSDGIDTDFFQRSRAQPVGRTYAAPLIFLPARITPTKGQADLVRAAGELKRRGLEFHVAFAGRTDTPAFFEELKRLIE